MENNNGFSYSYSAENQAEIERIRNKYMPKTEDKLEKLRRLDESVTSKATAWSLVLGILGTLIMGSGMSMVMTDFGTLLFASPIAAIIVGVVLGLVGMVMAIFAYPVYNFVLEKERRRIAPEIIRLADEIEK
jgi:hypothetical protein